MSWSCLVEGVHFLSQAMQIGSKKYSKDIVKLSGIFTQILYVFVTHYASHALLIRESNWGYEDLMQAFVCFRGLHLRKRHFSFRCKIMLICMLRWCDCGLKIVERESESLLIASIITLLRLVAKSYRTTDEAEVSFLLQKWLLLQKTSEQSVL